MNRAPSRLNAWLVRLERAHPVKIDLGLDRVATVLGRLRLTTMPCPVVTVAGTNGKGSSVAMLESIYAAAGYLTGAFTSPHLLRFNERIRVGGLDLDDARILDAFATVERARGEVSLSYFEFTTIAAAVAFRRLGVQVAILEVGLGGRLDAVNAIEPDIALVTSIGIDHKEWLGDDRESIGREKAGIFRAGRPAIVADRSPPASLARYARAIDAKYIGAGVDIDAVPGPSGWTYRGERTVSDLPLPGLAGPFQLDNALGVVAVVDALQASLPVADAALRAGLANVRLRGRFQAIDGPVQWVFDVAHNAESATALAVNLAATPAPATLAVVGILDGKPVDAFVGALVPHVSRWYVVTPPSPRALDAAHLAARIGAAGGEVASVFADVADGCRAAARDAATGARVLVTGSFYTVGAALAWHEAEGE